VSQIARSDGNFRFADHPETIEADSAVTREFS
jgi:hypothetical protein